MYASNQSQSACQCACVSACVLLMCVCVCMLAASGQYLDAVSNTCKACAAGFYCPGGTTAPIRCQPNYYCPANAAAPTACPTSPPLSPAGSTAASQCMVCQPGFYIANATTGVCAPCKAGAFCPGDGSITACYAAYYCPAQSAQPTPCPVNATTGVYQISQAGADAVDMCASCAPGLVFTASPMPTSPTYTGNINATCAPAPAGSVAVGGVAFPCPAGSYCAGGTQGAVACPNNTWSNAGASSASACVKPTCPAGQYLCSGQTIGAAHVDSCCACPMGFYCPGGSGLSSVVPLACPAGTSSNAGASSANQCGHCPAGSSLFTPTRAYKWYDFKGQAQTQNACVTSCFEALCGFATIPAATAPTPAPVPVPVQHW